VIIWLQDSPISAVAENFKLSCDEADGIMRRVVKRGLSRRKRETVREIGIDETAYQKRHDYMTVILDKDRDCVINVLDMRNAGNGGNTAKNARNQRFKRDKQHINGHMGCAYQSGTSGDSRGRKEDSV
jgi:transposase